MDDAGEAYESAAKIQTYEYKKSERDNSDYMKNWEGAANAFSEKRPADSARCRQEIIKYWTSLGNTRAAAPLLDKLGDTYMKKLGDTDKAIEAWEKAGNWFRNAQSMA